ncbi:GntR family transcriptional regulator [Brevibacillus massiliensis]|uniref:GntR family transcriptional regulator n=1 Tax=Brevibacillus massiliensis TaxID=1118054 RepID=UPI0002E14424|nr:GntR family transcriptional regulator [Brevibacillus massiliensis]
MRLGKIHQPRLFKQQAYEEIKNAIINHAILPGEALYERNLSESLGISRTPIREAIQLLEIEGWVKSVPRKGTFVSHILREDVEDVLQLRWAIEGLIMELIIPKITDEQIALAEKVYLQQSEHIADHKTFISIDKDFHNYFAELCGNRRVLSLMQTISDQMRWFGVQALNLPGRNEQTLQEHARILNAVKKRDLAEAKQAIAHHLNQTRVAIMFNLDQMGGHQ